MLLARCARLISSPASAPLARLAGEGTIASVPRRFMTKKAAGEETEKKPRARRAKKEEEEEEENGEESDGQSSSSSDSDFGVQAQNDTRDALGLFGNSFVEYRTYDIKPEAFPDFLSLTKEHIHLRTKHSPLLGYFVTELGGVNQVVHFWKYSSLQERQNVRSALSTDAEWIEKYIKPMRPMLAKQSNSLLVPVKNFENPYFSPASKNGVYLLRSGPSHPFGEAQEKLTESFTNNIELSETLNGEIVSAFTTVVGEQQDDLMLWYFPAFVNLEAVLQAERINHRPLVNKVLIPTPFSPLS
eukprot:TRINITY_DN661_c0_g1_i1.p2 TRINITY_DN661_c0_g1~~TRINITY_DN661_c0_g1_i1.p2  ORF type:complete len:300 (+),score=170.11 TRINITY_DN661_c0_g1_i1:62-961(+)